MAMLEATTDLRGAATRSFARRRSIAFGVPLVILAYLTYIFFSFDIPGLAKRASLENALTLVADSYSHKTHVVRDNRNGTFAVAIEGEAKGRYADGQPPEWVRIAGDSAEVALGKGYSVRFDGNVTRLTVPDYGVIETTVSGAGVVLVLPAGPVPKWINASDSRVTVKLPGARLTVTKSQTQVFRYFFGWELFWFTLDSPFYNKSPLTLAGMLVSGDQVVPGKSNLSAMATDFWTNKMWRHSDVAWAIFETILMAFLGTIGAAMIALPLAFLAASNFTPNWWVRFGFRRVFDFVRGVDGLIWTIILSRAFGPGPMTGALAILITDTGSFGKMFSEALENVDDKQIEGIQSTGANAVQRYRFGVIPQITPVLISQVLYYLESNTRSATVIGAIVGGGIGLLLTQAIITQKDWEEVTYYIVLIVLMVMLMDSISGWLRRKLIKGDSGGH